MNRSLEELDGTNKQINKKTMNRNFESFPEGYKRLTFQIELNQNDFAFEKTKITMYLGKMCVFCTSVGLNLLI